MTLIEPFTSPYFEMEENGKTFTATFSAGGNFEKKHEKSFK